MGGQPNSCTATKDAGVTFTAATGAFASSTATFGGGTLAGCLIAAAVTLNLDISAGAQEPAVGYYTIDALGALGAMQVTATGFGYAAFPSPAVPPTGTGGQALDGDDDLGRDVGGLGLDGDGVGVDDDRRVLGFTGRNGQVGDLGPRQAGRDQTGRQHGEQGECEMRAAGGLEHASSVEWLKRDAPESPFGLPH